jgi:hypothetical protein
MKYRGSCHCQKVRFEFETDLKEVMACNCSICMRRGHLLSFGPESNFKLLTDTNELSDYQWGKKKIHFFFCTICGCAPFGRANTPDGDSPRGENQIFLNTYNPFQVPKMVDSNFGKSNPKRPQFIT